MSWHPRGEPTWPDWQKAEPGTRVAHVRTGARGRLVRVVWGTTPGTRYAVIRWEPRGFFGEVEGRVVSPAFDLRPLDT